MKQSEQTIAKRATTRRTRLDALAATMYSEYLEGRSLAEVGRRNGGRKNTSVRSLFEARGLVLREDYRSQRGHVANGCFAPARPLDAAEVDALILSATKLRVPDALKLTWRKWSLAQRGDFLARLRAHLGRVEDRPTTPFSANVIPFDYCTAAAHEIMRRDNGGRSSQSACVKIRISSQGVIWDGALWFWVGNTGYIRGPHVPGKGRPALHHVIWERSHGRAVPDGHVIRFVDGNHNNLEAENLQLASRDSVCRENQAIALTSKSRAFTGALLTRSQGNPADHHEIIHLRRR